MARGITRISHPRVFGTIIGAAGAISFVWGSKGALGSPWSTVAVVAWAVALAAYLWSAFLAVRPFPPQLPLRRRAGLTYLLTVIAMLVGINGGRQVLIGLEREQIAIALNVVMVGLHFLPFAWAFRTHFFWILGCAVAPLGTLGFGDARPDPRLGS